MAANDHRTGYGTSPEHGLFERGPSRAAENKDPVPVQSVDRAITVLEILARQREAGVTDLAAELGVHKSTAFRLVGALERRGLVEQPGLRGKYRLGFGVIRLAGSMASGLDLTQQSRPVCEELAGYLGETVNIGIPSAGMVVNVDQVRGASAIVSQNWIGRQTHMHPTSSGKVLLAYMGRAERELILEAGLERLTSRTITDPQVLREQFHEIVERGYAVAVEELEVGLNAVGAPIRNLTGEVIAAVSVAGPSYRMTEDRLASIGSVVAKAAEEISARMGYIPPPGCAGGRPVPRGEQ